MFKKIKKASLTILSMAITAILFASSTLAEEAPKSLVKGYSDGGSIFKLPVFEPGKVKLDINSKYDRKLAYPEVNVSNKPGTAKPKKTISKTVTKTQEKPVPRSLNDGYSGGFVIKQKIEPEVGFVEEEIEVKTVAPKSKTQKTMHVNSKVIPFKPLTSRIQQAVKKKKRKPVVVIDPGHGGKDPGAIGKLGTKEKYITFLYSTSLKKELERSGRYKVILTRYADNYVPLKSRVQKARKHNGDILISIHADSIASPNVRGFSVYTISDRRVQREAGRLLKKSDKEEVIRGVEMRGESKDVKEALIDFAQKETKSVSDDLSMLVAKHLGRKVKPLTRTNREGSLAVLTGADIPSVLVELGYLSNKYEEKLLRTKEHRKKIVKSMKSALDEYFEKFDFFLE